MIAVYETSNILIIEPKDLLNDILIPFQLGDQQCKICLRKTMTSVIFLKYIFFLSLFSTIILSLSSNTYYFWKKRPHKRDCSKIKLLQFSPFDPMIMVRRIFIQLMVLSNIILSNCF